MRTIIDPDHEKRMREGMMAGSVRTCLVCRKRRHLPAFVAVNFDRDTLSPICEGCLNEADADKRTGAYLRYLEDQRFFMYYVMAEGSRASEALVPLMDEDDQKRIITRDFTGLTNAKDFWNRVYSGPAPAEFSIGYGSNATWSATVWRGSDQTASS